MSAEVSCTAGAFYPEEPHAFTWQGRRMVIKMIAARSHTPEGRRFHVLTKSEERFELIYSETDSSWSILPLEGPSP